MKVNEQGNQSPQKEDKMSNKIYKDWIKGEAITENTGKIKIKGHYGTWYAVAHKKYKG